MATSTSSLPLPEITTDDFERSWTRFHLVAAASKWDDEKKLLMLPALLRGKLVEIFISLSAEEKETLTKLKQALSDRAGITRDSLTSAKAFSERKQGAYESVRDYEIDLTRLFKEAYPNEDTTKSAVLLQGFLGGFRPEITRHILLKGTPNKPEDALKEALAVERALAFQGSEKHETPVQVVRTKTTPPAAEKCEDPRELQKLMSEMLIRLQSLESGLAERRKTDEAQRRDRRRCFTCHKLGHISRNCPTSEPRNSERPRRQGPYRGDSEEEDPVKVCGVDHTTLRVRGLLGERPIDFLVDSGAAVSVVTLDILPSSSRSEIDKTTLLTVGANGSPLDVIGRVNISITIGDFVNTHSFVVVRKLTVDCLLGVDFLTQYGAVIDCVRNTLSLNTTRSSLPLIAPATTLTPIIATVTVPETTQIPARSKRLISCRIQYPGVILGQEGLLEPDYKGQGRLLIARSLNTVDRCNGVVVQVINTGHESITLHSGTTVASFNSSAIVMTVNKDDTSGLESDTMPDVDLTGANLDHSQQEKLKQLIWKFRTLFATEKGPLGRTSVVKHTIKTDGPPIRQPLRRIPFALQSTVRTEIQKMLEQGVIQKSNSPWSSPVVMAKKKDGKWRFCIDYRKLNAVTHKDAYPLPRIDATLESLSGSRFFSTLDLASGYWQVEMADLDKEKTAFSTQGGHYEFNVMPFGLTNAPATFQRLMECVLAGLTYEQCLIYIDDIIVFSATFPQHLERLQTVLEHLAAAGLRLKPSKCHFAQNQICYLGHIVSQQGVQADPEKLRAVSMYPAPHNIKELRHFLGLANYYRRFIEGYSAIAEPLHKLTRKTAGGYKWSNECDDAFSLLKQKLTMSPILAYPCFQQPFILATDASEFAVGGVLSQKINGVERVISYWSRQLNKAERNYSTVEREALAVVAAVKEFYPYLYGRTFTLFTDHNPLTSLQGLKDTGGRITRWLLFLQQFDMKVLYRPGRNNGNADGLSRRPQGTEDPPQSQLHDDKVREVCGITCIEDTEKLRQEQVKDVYTSQIIEALKNGESTDKRGKYRYLMNDGVLCRLLIGGSHPPQVVVPVTLRPLVIEQLHDKSGHLGVHKTLEKLRERFYWPGCDLDVKNAIQQCDRCQKRNNPVPKQHSPIGTIKSNYPFEKLSWDIMGPLPTSSCGNKYILVVTDLFTKWVEAFPLAKTDSVTLAKVLVNEIVCRYGVPRYLHSDQGANLVSEVIKSLCATLGINRTQTTAYHPEGNGQVERFNRTLESMLAKVIADHQRDWDEHIQNALFAYRTAIHDSTGYTPFLVMFGRSPTLPIDVMLGQGEEQKELPSYVQRLQQSLRAAFSSVRKHLDVAHQRQKQEADKLSTGEGQLQVGDRVWLYVPAVKTGTTRKLASLWRGPYTVVDKLSSVNYKIQIIGGAKCQIVHRNRLKLCYSNPDLPAIQAHTNSEASSSKPNSAECFAYVEQDQDATQQEVVHEDDIIEVQGPDVLNDPNVALQDAAPDLAPPELLRRNPPRNRQPPLRYRDNGH